MKTPDYTPPQPPVGSHGGEPTPPTGSVAALTAQVRRLQVLVGVSTAASLVALVLGGYALLGRGTSAVSSQPVAPAASQPAPAASQTTVARPKPADAGTAPAGTIALGAVNQGKPVLDVYEDFQCPACKVAEDHFGPEVKQLVASGDVEVRYHMMSFLDQALRNDSSVRAANGGFCAHDQGKFLAYHDLLFANHPAKEGDGWTDAQLADLAGRAGVDGAAWQACVASGKHVDAVKQANDTSLAAGVNSTPTYRINGAKADLQGVANAGGLKAVIDSLR